MLDLGDRRLLRDGAAVDLNARYLDALALLVGEAGRLVSKDRFLAEVWRGVPVTDEALTQCIRTLRRQLGDEAGSPRFIETVPKHGYRFIAAVEPFIEERTATPSPPTASSEPAAPLKPAAEPSPLRGWRSFLLTAGAATVGGGLAGIVGGLFYGFAGASQPLAPGIGSASVLLVLVCLTVIAALVGAAGVGIGIAAACLAQPRFGAWTIAGAAAGGLVVGAFGKLLGLDAFHLLLGRSPGDITGAAEGFLLGAAVGLGAWLAGRNPGSLPLRRSMMIAGTVGAVAGILIPLLGGRLMGGSLDLLARSFPGSRLRLDQIGAVFGENGFGPVSQIVTGGLEGLLFAAGIVGAIIVARRSFGGEP
ncbi:MAG TPA: transcriptional regulator [Allosphingosinicella sp.]|nr:transcriptional regulator [Allosphingosinicella sp.]